MSDKVIKELKSVKEELKQDIVSLKKNIVDLKKELRGLIEIQQRLIHERLNFPMPNPPVEYGEPKKEVVKSTFDEKFKISNLGSDRIKIEGKTFDHKDLIKSSGYAKWESELKVWSLPLGSLEILIMKFKEAGFEDKDIKVEVIRIEEATEEDYQDNEEYGFV